MRGWASIISAKYCKGVQHNYRLAKNTKKKELGTAHHNDASFTGYTNKFKKQCFCQHMQLDASTLINYT